ncbi:uncharacterized protein [Triticum aestivum]|uniref:uncharacterized protein n=1 Tax=Triticum aestivum TaxID=4565 RepID=UPI001D025DFE|nr:uncharacterized protein LOC123090426 [Triticum aestivum]
MVAAVSKVLDDDDLLVEILLRVAFPTTLVHAALVCRRWFHHASDRRFLRRFRKIHPPRLLGFYAFFERARFIPMQPQPPELAVVVRHLASCRFAYYINIEDCRNGNVLTSGRQEGVWTHQVYHLLCPERDMPIIPPLPCAEIGIYHILAEILSKEEGDGLGLSYFYLLVELAKEANKVMVRVYMLQDGAWCMLTLATSQLHYPQPRPKPVLVHNKIYMAAAQSDDIIVLDLIDSSFSTIHLPQGVEYASSEIMLSRTNDASGVYLIHVRPKEFQLCVWLHKGGNWMLVDTIYLHEMHAILGKKDHPYVRIGKVGDDAQFVFLEVSRYIFYLDIKCRTLRKVYEETDDDRCYGGVHPFMMIWPPTFPALKDDPERNRSAI